jgi:hypothetical protein
VAIDILRKYPPAVAWLQRPGTQSLGLPASIGECLALSLFAVEDKAFARPFTVRDGTTGGSSRG